MIKLFLQSKQQSGKAKPRESASTARKVGQMRNTVRQMTGYKKGGTMENPKKQDRRVGKYEKKKTDEQQLIEFCTQRMARFKKPKKIILIYYMRCQ